MRANTETTFNFAAVTRNVTLVLGQNHASISSLIAPANHVLAVRGTMGTGNNITSWTGRLNLAEVNFTAGNGAVILPAHIATGGSLQATYSSMTSITASPNTLVNLNAPSSIGSIFTTPSTTWEGSPEATITSLAIDVVLSASTGYVFDSSAFGQGTTISTLAIASIDPDVVAYSPGSITLRYTLDIIT